MRRILTALLLISALAGAAEVNAAPYKGRSLAAVIDEFRDAGYPFAYSTNLVGSDLLVTIEPDADEILQIARQILRPHGLTIRTESNVHLIVRYNSSGLSKGSILLVITARGSDRAVSQAAIVVEPGLANSDPVSPGVFEFPDVSPGRYQFNIQADGLEMVRRLVDVWPGDTTVVDVGMEPLKPALETIAVSASRYDIQRDIAGSRVFLDQRTIQNMPDIGEDPLRVTHRLPGAAASGASAKTHFRGGEDSEIGIVLNGLRLFDPFHVRDYHSIFSTIDSRAIEGVEVYTGGFPVRFGDRMSGLVLIEALEPLQSRHFEIGVSVLNTSLLAAGKSAGQRWLLSARRGNLDLVIDPELSQPNYYDIFAEYEYDISADTTASFNAMFADDSVLVFLENDLDELERLVSDTENAQFWIQLKNRWSGELTSTTVLSALSFRNRRVGSLGDTKKIVATVFDALEVEQFGFKQEFSWSRSDAHLLQWGLEASYSAAEYDYQNTGEYFELQALYENHAKSVSSDLSASPKGSNYALYFADRWRVSPNLVLEWGLRWDDQTYTESSSDSQLSPRINVMRLLGQGTEVRLSWGRYHQSQAIHELQIEDGVTNFWPAQRADHWIAGVRHLFRDVYSLRVEMFVKDMQRVRPRFENLYDPLGLVPEIQPDRIRIDPTSARNKGIEVSLDRSNGPLTWWASYTYSKATDRIDGNDEYRSWDQPHAFQGGISWSNPKWDVSIAANVHTGWPATDLNLVEDDDSETGLVAIPGPRNALRHGTFASLDLRISRTWKLKRSSIMTFVEVSNLTDRRNECCIDFEIIRSEDTGEIILENESEYWLPLLPSVGFLWEF